MQSFNFCHSRLNPCVTSSRVSAEGYEVTNLISCETEKQRKGFMVYHTINPPVDVTFTFMCKINISHIIIWPQVGNQKSSGFQISTHSSNSLSATLNLSEGLVNVGCGFLVNEPGIVFYNTQEPHSTSISGFMRKRLSGKQNVLCGVSALQVRIVKTHQSSIPALFKVEIWGLPSVSCPRELRMKVLDLWNGRHKNVEVKEKVERKTEDVLRVTAKILTDNEFTIPEDFIDPITCEIMVLPFTLPSGKIVDQTTLDKHKNQEANWGRMPSDPFTGKLFTDTCRPILAVALKARIDRFLIEHADKKELQSVPRTVGRKLGHTNMSSDGGSSGKSNKYKETSVKKREINSKVDNGCSTSKPIEHTTTVNVEAKERRVLGEKHKIKYDVIVNERKKLKVNEECNDGNKLDIVYVEKESKNSEQSHEDILNDSLNAALKSALCGLPSFTNFDKKAIEVRVKCAVCNGTEVLYVLPCQHFICRSCLTEKVNSKNCVCSFCVAQFSSSDPKRYHT